MKFITSINILFLNRVGDGKKKGKKERKRERKKGNRLKDKDEGKQKGKEVEERHQYVYWEMHKKKNLYVYKLYTKIYGRKLVSRLKGKLKKARSPVR